MAWSRRSRTVRRSRRSSPRSHCSTAHDPGDAGATERLLRRFLPVLQRWAHRRLPAGARSMAETDDLVQVTLMRALHRVPTFEHRREGAFLAYLRTILMNIVREEVRRSRGLMAREQRFGDARRAHVELERLIGRERIEAYEQGLLALPEGSAGRAPEARVQPLAPGDRGGPGQTERKCRSHDGHARPCGSRTPSRCPRW